jgi:hypothetical protein
MLGAPLKGPPNIKLQLWLEEGISDYKYLTYLGHKDLHIIKNIEEKYDPDLKLFAKNILLATFNFRGTPKGAPQ